MFWTLILLLLAFIAGIAFARHFRAEEDLQVFADAVLIVATTPLRIFRKKPIDENERWGLEEDPFAPNPKKELDSRKVDEEIAKKKTRRVCRDAEQGSGAMPGEVTQEVKP